VLCDSFCCEGDPELLQTIKPGLNEGLEGGDGVVGCEEGHHPEAVRSWSGAGGDAPPRVGAGVGEGDEES